jgi:hypothetical protein
MKKEQLKEGMKCKVTELLTDAEGALYENDIVQVVDWTEVGKSDDTVVVYVTDDVGKHHTVGLKQIRPL